MTGKGRFTLKKEERISSRKLTDKLFGKSGSKAMSAFPLRMVYTMCDKQDNDEPQAKMLVSVPKRYFKRAVKRNRVKRQVREAYRKNKHLLATPMQDNPDKYVALAFIWIDDKLHNTQEVEQKVQNLLNRLGEKL